MPMKKEIKQIKVPCLVYNPALQDFDLIDMDEEVKKTNYLYEDYKLENLIAIGVTPSALSTSGSINNLQSDAKIGQILDFAESNVIATPNEE